jgi:hypothetical protein
MEAAKMETGMVAAGISVARRLPRNRNMTTRTMTPVSPSATSTFFIDSRMNIELSMFTSNVMSCGSVSRMSAISFLMAAETSSTLAVDNGVTGIISAGLPSMAEPPRWFSAAICTWATSPRRTR